MSAITTHVLDISLGRPAAGVVVELEAWRQGAWTAIGAGHTDADGRLSNLLAEDVVLEPGQYRLTFETGAYFAAAGHTSLYPRVVIEIAAVAGESHYHVPLLLSAFGYSTYRGT